LSLITRALIEAATSRLGEPRWRSSVRCIAGAESAECSAWIEVTYDGVNTISWSCSKCAETGTITGFVGDDNDLSVFVEFGPEVVWTMDERELELLTRATASLPELRGTIVRAEPDDAGRLVVRATVEELDDILKLVEHLRDSTRARAKAELVVGLERSLSAAVRGASTD